MKDESDDIGMLFKQIAERLQKKGNAYFSSLGITMTQIRVLHFIFTQSQKKTTQKELEDFCNVSHPTINGILKRLEEKGFIETTITVNGRLSKEVFLTDKGTALLHETKKSKHLAEKTLMKDFTKQEIDMLKEMLKRIIGNLSE
jgi:DNA-binding MarR family transcriptional regulator